MPSAVETDLLLDAERAHGVFSRADARRRGVADAVIDQRLRTGAIEQMQPRVFRVLGAPLTYEAEVVAALKAATDDEDAPRGRVAAASHRTAALLMGLLAYAADPDRDPIEVTVTGEALPLLWGDVLVHRTAQMPASDLAWSGSILRTSGARTGVDLVGCHDRLEVPRIADELIGGRHTAQAELHGRARRLARGRRNVAALRDVTAPGAADRFNSWLERTGEALLRRGGVPPGVWNQPLHEDGRDLGIPDLLLARWRIIIELDGPRFHRTAAQVGRDRALDRLRTLAGYLVLRFDYWEVVRTPEAVLQQVHAAIAVRS